MNDICGIIFIILVSMITDTRGHRHQQLLIISGDCLFHSCGNSFYWVSVTRRKFFNSEASKASSEKKQGAHISPKKKETLFLSQLSKFNFVQCLKYKMCLCCSCSTVHKADTITCTMTCLHLSVWVVEFTHKN